MIKGYGIDIEDIASIRRVYKNNPRFVSKVLTFREFTQFISLSSKRKMEYLAGRWAAKEAFLKAYGGGIGMLAFKDLEILNNEKGAPFFSKSPFQGRVWVSLSHTRMLVSASVILEEEGNES